MDSLEILLKYYPDDDALRHLLLQHSRQVAQRCLLVARRHPELQLDTSFLEEAALLHDMGIRWCHAPSIHCHGTQPYIMHGTIGARLLRQEGMERHARVCERHTGTGITPDDILRQQLPLDPGGHYVPETLEEQVVCYADKFFSKSRPEHPLTVNQVVQSIGRFGKEGVQTFQKWNEMFG